MNIVNPIKKFQLPPASVLTWQHMNISGFHFVDRQCNKNMNNEKEGTYKYVLHIPAKNSVNIYTSTLI